MILFCIKYNQSAGGNVMENKKLFIHSKTFFFITELFVGIALMGIEMSASRLVSVYFSSSQVVWTIIIGVIMIAMAIGNFWGGRQADKKPSYKRLYLELLFAGAYIVLIPFIGKYVIVAVSMLFAVIAPNSMVIWAALFSCLILFVPPLLFLGKVTPSLVKYMMGEKVSGKVVGILEALNTVGSIIGTFIPTFLTIPFIGTSNSFILFGGMIAILGIVFILTTYIDYYRNKPKLEKIYEVPLVVKEKKKNNIKTIVLSGIYSVLFIFGIAISANAPFAFWSQPALVKEGESTYNYLRVDRDENGLTTLSTNILFGVQSAIYDDFSLTGMYYDYLLPSIDLVKENPSILVLGNGTGTYATMLKEYMKKPCVITAIEIDQKIIDYSYQYFHMSKDVTIICDDGRNYLTRSKDSYDIILVHAYTSISAPFHMTTVEFFSLVHSHLNDNGLMMMNINLKSNAPGSINEALCDTASQVFPNLYTYQVSGGSGIEVYSYKGEKDVLTEVLSLPAYDNQKYVGLNQVMNRLKNSETGLLKYKDTGIRLYDETADVEIRSIRALAELIRKYLDYYLEILRERGIIGLIEILM